MHVCCAPCSVYPVKILKSENNKIRAFFFNPNIHPSQEYMKRKEALKTLGEIASLDIIWGRYEMDVFFDKVKNGDDRCRSCYELRLDRTALEAGKLGYDTFSTTLLYSIRQKHELIKEMGFKAGEKHGINFHYRDFRVGWKSGVEESKKRGLYRQNYCGCIFSEKERFYREWES